MALTKGDLKSIENLLDTKLDEKFVDHLSLLEKRLDKKMDKRFDEVNERLNKIDKRLENLHSIGVHLWPIFFCQLFLTRQTFAGSL